MAIISLQDAFCYVGGYDFTTDTNSATLTTDVAQLDATTFNSNGWTELAGGLKSTTFAYSGFWSGTQDQNSFGQTTPVTFGVAEPCTFGPVETENQVAYIFNAMKSQYTLGGQVGELAPFSVTANGAPPDGVIRGRLAAARQTVAGVGALGSGLNLGALSASNYLYATLHVFTVPGTASPSLTVQVQSDDNSGFTSPTTVATFPVVTDASGPFALGPTGNWLTKVAGPITDTWFRLNVSAVTGSGWVAAGAIGKA